MCSLKDAVLSALMSLPQKKISNVSCVGLADLIHALCGDHPDARVAEDIKSTLIRLECDGNISLLRMDTPYNDGPILGVHLNQES